MGLAEITFASGGGSFSVRSFKVQEVISGLFEIDVVAMSPEADVDLESIIGSEAALHLARDGAVLGGAGRNWKGVCNRLEQLQAELTGLSTYSLRIVPELWLLTQRREHRIFQHLSVPHIVEKILREWSIEATFRLDQKRFPELEYRVQAGETDFAFVSRLLEEAGITYFFEDSGSASQLILSDGSQLLERRHGGPLVFVDNPTGNAVHDFVTKVGVVHEIRPDKYTIRDFDFRGRIGHPRVGSALSGGPSTTLREQYHYVPGGFVDDKGAARASDQVAADTATLGLESVRASKREVTFQTNVLDLAPGVVFVVADHPHPDLDAKHPLRITRMSFEGTHDGEWKVTGRAVSAAKPYRPPRLTPKPKIFGVQSAIVVGPGGAEIHTDEYGRVRVRFHWDREEVRNPKLPDEDRSCWVRVSQAWAGGRYGLITIPRIGQEVLVGFFEGDPDQPVVMGRVFNNEERVPYDLPANKTVSTWKSSSSPASGGFNEIKFEDARGRELVYMQAERNLDKLVKVNESETTGVDRTVAVGVNRTTTIGAIDASVVGARYSVNMVPLSGGAPTGIEMIDNRIVLTTGEASITLEGPNITLAAKGLITIKSDGDDVVLQGGPWVKINCGAEGEVVADTVTMHHITGILRDQDGVALAGRKVVVTASDGAVHEVETDGAGRYFAVVPPGKCQVSLPGGLRYGTKGPHFDDMNLDAEHFDDCGPVV